KQHPVLPCLPEGAPDIVILTCVIIMVAGKHERDALELSQDARRARDIALRYALIVEEIPAHDEKIAFLLVREPDHPLEGGEAGFAELSRDGIRVGAAFQSEMDVSGVEDFQQHARTKTSVGPSAVAMADFADASR